MAIVNAIEPRKLCSDGKLFGCESIFALREWLNHNLADHVSPRRLFAVALLSAQWLLGNAHIEQIPAWVIVSIKITFRLSILLKEPTRLRSQRRVRPVGPKSLQEGEVRIEKGCDERDFAHV
jgi:hypothetical protein